MKIADMHPVNAARIEAIIKDVAASLNMSIEDVRDVFENPPEPTNPSPLHIDIKFTQMPDGTLRSDGVTIERKDNL